MTDQLVMRKRDGCYTVQTFEAQDGVRVLVKEAPANARSIAQATLAGDIYDQDEGETA